MEFFLRKSSGVLVTLFLAWFIAPEDFGLVAMITIFITVSTVFINGGFVAALIRQKEVTELQLNSVFFIIIALALFIYALLFFLAPVIASFYQQPRLVEILRVASLSFVFLSLSIVHSTVMQRKLLFKLQFKTSLPSAILSGVIAVALAYLGFGVWAIIAQMVVFSALNTLLLWNLKIWHPQFQFSLNAIKPIFRFGVIIFVEAVIKEIFLKMNLAVIGKFYALDLVGLFFFAGKVADLIVQQAISSVQRVTFPVLSQLQDDPVRLKEGYRKVIQLTVFLIYPIFIITAALSEPIFDLILPDKWSDAVSYLQLMLLISVIVPVNMLTKNIIMVRGKAKLLLVLTLIENSMLMIMLYFTISIGIHEILVGAGVILSLFLFIRAYFIKQLISYSYIEQFTDLVSVLVISLFSGTAVLYLVETTNWSSLIQLPLFFVIGLSLYLSMAYFFNLAGLTLFRGIVVDKFKNRQLTKP